LRKEKKIAEDCKSKKKVLLNEFSFHWFSNQAISFSPKKMKKIRLRGKHSRSAFREERGRFFWFFKMHIKESDF
jgi:hypothetical protein